jgi:hypothetical protein
MSERASAAWLMIKDKLAVKSPGGKEKEQWIASARLLRVLPCSHSYAWNVEHAFQRRRGSALLISPLDWMHVESWADAGVHVSAIIRGIDEVFDRSERQPNKRQINSLAFCQQQILRESELMKEAAVGSPLPPRPAVAVQTLLVALPPSGRTIFAALQNLEKSIQAAHQVDMGIAFTVYPDEWQKCEALERFSVHLSFLDPVNQQNLFISGSRLAGLSRRGFRQPFLRRQEFPA